MASPPRILIIDDDPASREILRLLIHARWPNTRICEVYDALSLARAMRNPVRDLCVVDPNTSWTDAKELLELLCDDDAVGPVVVYSRSDRAEAASNAIRAGATNYFVPVPRGGRTSPKRLRFGIPGHAPL